MNNRERFYNWMVSDKNLKESKAKEFLAALDLVDEKCVRAKGEGQYGIYTCDSLKTFEYILKNFLISKQVGAIIGGKTQKLFNKFKDYISEYYENVAFNSDVDDNEETAEAVVTAENVEVIEEAADEIAPCATIAEEGCDPVITEPLSRRYDRVITQKVNDVYAEVSGLVTLRPQAEISAENGDCSAYFDLMNGTVGIECRGKIGNGAMAEIYKENDRIYGKNGNAFLCGKNRLFISDNMGGQSSEDNVIENAIFYSLNDVKLKYNGVYAMVPDVLDDFAKETRAQLVYKGTRIFPVPRSVAYALGYQAELRLKGSDYAENSKIVFADYDGDAFVAIELDVSKDSTVGYSIFTRMGVYDVKDSHLRKNYNELFDECIRQYGRVYGITFEDATLRELRASRAFARLFGTRESILLRQSDGYVRLDYDQKIHDRICGIIDEDVKSLRNVLGKNTEIVVGSALYRNVGVEYLGCSVVQERIAKKLPLWREYLPHLSLEVIKDGRYGEIELIKKNEYRDVLKTLGEEEIIHVENGTLTFMAGREFYSLPLERDIKNDAYKEKQSVFRHKSFPLKKDVSVSLEIHYKYGDANSYKLVARALDKNAPFDIVESEWTDREPLPLGKVSKFVSTGGMMPREGFVKDIRDCFNDMGKKLEIYNNHWNPTHHRRNQIINRSPDGKKVINLFYRFSTRRGFFVRRKTLNEEAYKSIPEVRSLIDEIPTSPQLRIMYEIAFGIGRFFDDLQNEFGKEVDQVRFEARKLLSDFGYLYQAHDLSWIIREFIKLKQIKFLASVSRCLTDDRYGVYEAISRKIATDNDGADPNRVRNFASNCNYISGWAKNLYNTEYGPEALEKIRDSVIELIMNHDLTPKTNPRTVRDYMELLVCICTINEIDNKFIDPNDPKIKKLVKKIKEIDDVIYKCDGVFKTGKDDISFVCRLQTSGMDKMGLDNMHDLTFMLVQILTGAQDINLTGFDDNDD